MREWLIPLGENESIIPRGGGLFSPSTYNTVADIKYCQFMNDYVACIMTLSF